MNIVKLMKKQIENGKTIITKDGNIISKEEIRKTALKSYLAGIKAGEIATTKSFEDYLKEIGGAYVEVSELVDIIEHPDEDCDGIEDAE